MHSAFSSALRELAETADRVATQLGPDLDRAYEMVRETVQRRGTLFFCGNGGSAADAQHMATEYVVRYMRNRRAYPAVALTTDTSLLTAAGNDIGFEQVFARQVEGLGARGDVLLALSTSGRSPNVLAALRSARERGLVTIGFTGSKGEALGALCDHLFVSPSDDTPVVQQIHLSVAHGICDAIEQTMMREGPRK